MGWPMPYVPFDAMTSLVTAPGNNFANLFDSQGMAAQYFGLSGQTPASTSPFASYAKASAEQYFKPSTPAPASKTQSNATTVKTLNTVTAVFAGINAAIGQFYAAKTTQYELQSNASRLQYQSGMDAINAHSLEMNAQAIQEQGKTDMAQYTMRAGQEQAASTAGTAARGIDLSSESAIDQRASNDLVKQLQVLTINSNATRAAWAARMQATTASNQSLLDSTSAANDRTLADAVSPFGQFGESLLGSVSSIASKWEWKPQ